MRTATFTMVLFGSLTLLSFAINGTPPGPPFIGTYGVGCCGEEASTSPKLILNADGTYVYADRTDPQNVIEASGTWTVEKNSIRLSGGGAVKFRDSWKVDGSCLTSRKGLSFYRLCSLDFEDKWVCTGSLVRYGWLNCGTRSR
jgi:hypothetical protein